MLYFKDKHGGTVKISYLSHFNDNLSGQEGENESSGFLMRFFVEQDIKPADFFSKIRQNILWLCNINWPEKEEFLAEEIDVRIKDVARCTEFSGNEISQQKVTFSCSVYDVKFILGVKKEMPFFPSNVLKHEFAIFNCSLTKNFHDINDDDDDDGDDQDVLFTIEVCDSMSVCADNSSGDIAKYLPKDDFTCSLTRGDLKKGLFIDKDNNRSGLFPLFDNAEDCASSSDSMIKYYLGEVAFWVYENYFFTPV
ncbi:hypothetical protein GUI12_00030 [Anaplasmataceae bacterium AB001_6]|nr:hypothetical protein GUI12_00030 [Anaplasmataceae bacterium AB001_6]